MYPEFFHILDALGLSTWPYKSPFSWNEDAESFENARLQTGMVVFVAEKIADALLRAWAIKQEVRDSVVQAAVLHNALKHLEVIWKKEVAGLKPYSEAWYDKLREQLEQTWSKAWRSDIEIASMMRKVIGHTSLKDFIVMSESGVVLNPERSLSEMVIHIASDMVGAKNPKFEGYTSNIQVSSFVDRAAFADFSDAYPFLWKEWLAVSEGTVEELKDITQGASGEWAEVKNFFDWQDKIYRMICTRIASELDLQSNEDPVEFIVNLVNESWVDWVKGWVAGDVADTLKWE